MSTEKELKKEIERGVWDASLGKLYGRRAGVLERSVRGTRMRWTVLRRYTARNGKPPSIPRPAAPRSEATTPTTTTAW